LVVSGAVVNATNFVGIVVVQSLDAGQLIHVTQKGSDGETSGGYAQSDKDKKNNEELAKRWMHARHKKRLPYGAGHHEYLHPFAEIITSFAMGLPDPLSSPAKGMVDQFQFSRVD
jgi:hypothetical protein